MAQRVTVLGCTPNTCATSARVSTSGPTILRVTFRNGTTRIATYRYGYVMSASLQARYLDRVEAPEIDYRAELPLTGRLRHGCLGASNRDSLP